MKKRVACPLLLAFLFIGLSASAASTLRLVYGEWSPAGRAVKATLTGDAFKRAAKGAYRVECVNETGRKPAKGNLGSLKLPVIFAISEKGNCYLALENVPAKSTAEEILGVVRRADDIRREAEKQGFATADVCGAFLARMEKRVGGPRRVIAIGFYRDVFEKLKKLDPNDETGWIRRYVFGDEFSKKSRGDGYELVERATKFREASDFAGGAAFLKRQKELPSRHLTTEQRQSLALAEFALYRDDKSKRDALIELLRATAAEDATTFWGAAAVGWLKIWKVPTDGLEGDKKPDGRKPPPRKARSTSVAFNPSPKSVVGKYLVRTISAATFSEIAAKEGGADFLKTFFADVEWMEQFAGSGPAGGEKASGTGDLGAALKALDFLVWADRGRFILVSKTGRNLATALALNHGATWDETKFWEVFSCYRAWAGNGTLYEPSRDYDVYQWRQAVSFARMDYPVENLRWIHRFANTDMEAYFRLIWQVPYRKRNCFGDSIYKPRFYEPWRHRFPYQELVHRVGGVCGELSKFASYAAAARGIRSFPVGQPGHCAYAIRTEDPDRWGIGNNVTHHTKPRQWGCRNFTDLEEQTRFYESDARLPSERARWQGDYARALKLGANAQAADAWRAQLEKAEASAAEWTVYGEAVRQAFASAAALSNGWRFYLPYIRALKGDAARLEAARQGFLAFKENRARTLEAPYFDEIALDPIAKIFRKDDDLLALLPAILEGQTGSRTCGQQALQWASEKLMKDGESSRKFQAIMIAHAEKTNMRLDYAALILKASQDEDLIGFRQVYALMDRLSPKARPPAGKKTWPASRNGGALLSAEGLLKTSSSGKADDPVRYRHALDATDFKGEAAFCTAEEAAPWATVVLPGDAEISAVTIVNAGPKDAQTPLRVWLSDDGTDWEEAFASADAKDEWLVRLASPVKAKYVKVGRQPDEKKSAFRLRKILVYGEKLY